MRVVKLADHLLPVEWSRGVVKVDVDVMFLGVPQTGAPTPASGLVSLFYLSHHTQYIHPGNARDAVLVKAHKVRNVTRATTTWKIFVFQVFEVQ